MINPQSAVAGEWSKADDEIRVTAAPGARLVLPVAPKGEYDFRVSFTRETGQHSIDYCSSTEAGCVPLKWMPGAASGGVSSRWEVRTSVRIRPAGRDHTAKRTAVYAAARSPQGSGRGWLDETEIASLSTRGDNLALSDLWKLPQSTHLAIAAWDSQTTFHAIEVRSVNGAPIAIGSPGATPSVAGTSPGSPMLPVAPHLRPASGC